jgi:hypothetical protein
MKEMIRIILVFLMSGCCNLPLVDCVKDYYYIAEEGLCKDGNSFCYSSRAINVKISPDFVDAILKHDGNGEYQSELVINIENQTGEEIIINNNNLNVYCLVDNDTLRAVLDTFEYNIEATNKEKITLTPDFVVDKKYQGFFKEHKFGVSLRLLDDLEIRSTFEIQSKRIK